MKIKTYKDVYKSVSENINEPEDTVERVGNYIWADLADRVSGLKGREFYMIKFGSFRFRKLRAEKYIKSIPDLLTKKNPTFGVKMYESAILIKDRVQELIDEWNEILEDKRKFKEKLNESNGDIQESKPDLGGTKEQSI